MTTPGIASATPQRRMSDLIGLLPSRNLHLGVRLARAIGLDLNQFVTFNFSQTACAPETADLAFAKLRASFGKWARRPEKSRRMVSVPPTFVWVIENANDILNAHWIVHVPADRQAEFAANLPRWFEAAVGNVYSEKAIKIKTVTNAEGLKAYLLKGLHPSVARTFGSALSPAPAATSRLAWI